MNLSIERVFFLDVQVWFASIRCTMLAELIRISTRADVSRFHRVRSMCRHVCALRFVLGHVFRMSGGTYVSLHSCAFGSFEVSAISET